MVSRNFGSWCFSVGLSPKALRFLRGSGGRLFYLCLESSNKENWYKTHDLWPEGNGECFAKFLTHFLKSSLGRKWEKQLHSNEHLMGRSTRFISWVLQNMVGIFNHWTSRKCVPLLGVSRITDLCLRNMNVSLWTPHIISRIFSLTFPYYRSVNTTVLLVQATQRHTVQQASAETTPTLN